MEDKYKVYTRALDEAGDLINEVLNTNKSDRIKEAYLREAHDQINKALDKKPEPDSSETPQYEYKNEIARVEKRIYVEAEFVDKGIGMAIAEEKLRKEATIELTKKGMIEAIITYSSVREEIGDEHAIVERAILKDKGGNVRQTYHLYTGYAIVEYSVRV